MESKIGTYVRIRAKKTLKESREKYVHNSVLVYVKDKMPASFDLDEVIAELERTIPVELFHEVDSIYIGQFKEINDRDLESVYKDGSIYTTNLQTSEQSMYETIVHELAHALEEVYGLDIYMDDLIEREFLGKRKKNNEKAIEDMKKVKDDTVPRWMREGLDAETARLLSLETALGAARLAVASTEDPGNLQAQVTSPGGTTEAAINVLNDSRVGDTLQQAVSAARARAGELAKLLDQG